jgi:uncharacterized membrane protein YraQ (UPF0718 family)
MRKSGISVGAALAFWLGNPTLNPAVLVFLLFALSWQWALLRLVVGVVLVFGVSWWVARTFPETIPAPTATALADPASPRPQAGGPLERWIRALAGLAIGLLPEYLVIVVALGAARAWLFPAMNPQLGHSLPLLVGLALAGTLFVIPTAGEIPIVQTLMHFGLGAGPAGALLLTLAPVSLPSLAMVSRVFPTRVLLVVAGAVALAGVLGGLTALALGF